MGQHLNSAFANDDADDELRLAPLDSPPVLVPTPPPLPRGNSRADDDQEVGGASDEIAPRAQYSISQLLLATAITALILTAVRWAVPELLAAATGAVALGFFAWVSFTQPGDARLFRWSYALLVIYLVLCLGTCLVF